MADTQPDFAPNQQWSYRTRPQDVGSTIAIGLIQDDPKMGRIVHIAVLDVNVKSPRSLDGVATQLGHLPISETALRASVTKMKGVVEPPQSVPRGVEEWERARGGVFTISVAEAVDYLEQALNGTPPAAN